LTPSFLLALGGLDTPATFKRRRMELADIEATSSRVAAITSNSLRRSKWVSPRGKDRQMINGGMCRSRSGGLRITRVETALSFHRNRQRRQFLPIRGFRGHPHHHPTSWSINAPMSRSLRKSRSMSATSLGRRCVNSSSTPAHSLTLPGMAQKLIASATSPSTRHGVQTGRACQPRISLH
jgi:hypothetical protein